MLARKCRCLNLFELTMSSDTSRSAGTSTGRQRYGCSRYQSRSGEGRDIQYHQCLLAKESSEKWRAP